MQLIIEERFMMICNLTCFIFAQIAVFNHFFLVLGVFVRCFQQCFIVLPHWEFCHLLLVVSELHGKLKLLLQVLFKIFIVKPVVTFLRIKGFFKKTKHKPIKALRYFSLFLPFFYNVITVGEKNNNGSLKKITIVSRSALVLCSHCVA